MAESELLKTPEVADLLHVTGETVRSWVKQNKIRHIVLPSGQPRFRRSDIDAILAGQPVAEEAS